MNRNTLLDEQKIMKSLSKTLKIGAFISIIALFVFFLLQNSSKDVLSRTIKVVSEKNHTSYNWPRSSVNFLGLTNGELNELIKKWSQQEQSYSFLIAYKGDLIFEEYYNGHHSEMPNVLKSVCKLWVTTLTGIAIKKGFVSGVDQSAADFLPDEYQDIPLNDPRRKVTIEHLLSMRSGYQVDDNNIETIFISNDWVRDAANGTLKVEPGKEYFYSTSQTHLLSGVLSAAIGEPLHNFASRELCEPLGISIRQWDTDPLGIPIGGSGLRLTSRDLLRLGQLYLQDGFIDGKQILPTGWVQKSFQNLRPNSEGNTGYAYNWRTSDTEIGPVKIALGNGGQALALYPDQELAMVVTRYHKKNARMYNNNTLHMFKIIIPNILAQSFHEK